MEYVIELLQKEREVIIMALKNGTCEKLYDLQQIDKAIGWLKLIQDNDLDKACRYDLEALPYIEGYGGFTYYRLMIDKETDDIAKWIEYEKPDGRQYHLSLGDFLLIHK